MNPTGSRGGLLAALLLLIAAPLAGQQADSTLPGWLTGCWRQASAALVVEEIWLPPAGGAIMGLGRTIRQDTLLMWEQLVIRRGPAGYVLEASPAGQPRASFPATVLSDTLLLFENPEHDFPQAVRYERRGADSLHAQVSGTVRERQRAIAFDYARVACPVR